MTFEDSFEAMKKWERCLRDDSNIPDPILAIVGNKSDLYSEIQVSTDRAKSYQREVGAHICMETSAKEGDGIEMLFKMMAKQLLKRENEKS